jgi:hypothetical protein
MSGIGDSISPMSPSGSRADVGAEANVSLLPLTPSYEVAAHGSYLRHLSEALDPANRGRVRNVALTGGYGVGKSSILQKLSEDLNKRSFLQKLGKDRGEKAVTLSLPTLGGALSARLA